MALIDIQCTKWIKKKRTFQCLAHSRHSKYNYWINKLKNKIAHDSSKMCYALGSV